jgi:hypothetical protein
VPRGQRKRLERALERRVGEHRLSVGRRSRSLSGSPLPPLVLEARRHRRGLAADRVAGDAELYLPEEQHRPRRAGPLDRRVDDGARLERGEQLRGGPGE